MAFYAAAAAIAAHGASALVGTVSSNAAAAPLTAAYSATIVHIAVAANRATVVATASDASRAAVGAAEVATCPAVVQSEVCTARSAEVCTVAVVVAVRAVQVPGMSATVCDVEVRASEVEVVAVRIAGIDAEVPITCAPVQWAVEVAGCDVCLPLCVEQNVAQVAVAALPVVAIDIVVARHTHQVVEVDLVGGLILFVGEVQLVSHFIGQEQCLVASLFVTHCLARCCYRQHC